MDAKGKNPAPIRKPSPESAGAEELPPWEQPDDKIDGEEVTATTKTLLEDGPEQSFHGKSGGFDDTVITKPADRVHADMFGGGESLFGDDSAMDKLRGLLSRCTEWWGEHTRLGWHLLMAVIGLVFIIAAVWLFHAHSPTKQP